ncbi:polysaccharide lyase family 7 protein [Ekhidna sp. MALMAid0563]|uniref:polysaccharide lyase family 7 protein n=1 Tax=Ekhidna sp. MALMAid0563 TaxID=3143937 RepID=UPI0032DF1B29
MIDKKMIDKLLRLPFLILLACCVSCNSNKKTEESENTNQKSPSDVISNLDEWKILLGNGESVDSLQNFEHKDYFYDVNDGKDWVVYKAPNGGITSPNSHNTRTELGQKYRWTPKEGGRLTGTLKVMHVSTSGDARVAASHSVVVGQIHSDDGHKNEPLKIFYKKFPGHTKGSVFWNYEINTDGDDNSGRWDFSTAIWGYDMSVVGSDSASYPAEPTEGIELGEEFSYEINVYDGMMYLTFMSEGHETKTFTKNLLVSDFQNKEDIPEQTMNLFVPIGQDGVERANAYAGETQFFKQGAYNQTNGRDPETNMVWSTGANTYNGDVEAQYANGSYTEVWFRESSIGSGTPPNQ